MRLETLEELDLWALRRASGVHEGNAQEDGDGPRSSVGLSFGMWWTCRRRGEAALELLFGWRNGCNGLFDAPHDKHRRACLLGLAWLSDSM